MPIEWLVPIAVDVGISVSVRAAEKFAPYFTPIVSRLFHRRFKNQGGLDVATAAARLEPFLGDLDNRIGSLEEDGSIADEQVQHLFSRPEVTGALYEAFEAAMETDDELSRATLAQLVIERLRAPEGSVWESAARMAIEAVRNLTPRQIRLLALMSFLHQLYFVDEDIQTLSDDRADEYVTWLRGHEALILEPRSPIDLTHIVGFGLAEQSPIYSHLESGFTPSPLVAIYLRFPGLANDARIQDLVHAIGETASGLRNQDGLLLAAYDLTPAGSLIAESALREVRRDVKELLKPGEGTSF